MYTKITCTNTSTSTSTSTSVHVNIILHTISPPLSYTSIHIYEPLHADGEGRKLSLLLLFRRQACIIRPTECLSIVARAIFFALIIVGHAAAVGAADSHIITVAAVVLSPAVGCHIPQVDTRIRDSSRFIGRRHDETWKQQPITSVDHTAV